MSNNNLKPIDTFNVVNYSYLNDSDRKILIMLYQPIVGAIGINLYFNLWSFLDKEIALSETNDHKILLNVMGVSIKEIIESREKLEGIGLIKTYLKEGEINNYIYELYSPLSAYDFFSNPLLSSVLFTSLGSLNYKKTKEYFKVPKISTKDYINITKNFINVYTSVNMMETSNSDIKKKNYENIGIQSDLDVEELISLIPDVMLDHKKVTDNIRDLIIKLSFIYGFDFNTTTNIVKNSINEKHAIDKDLLKNNYRNYYQFENNGSMPSVVFKTQPDNLKKQLTDDSKKSKIIYQFENTNPYNYICAKSKSTKPTKAEMAILEMLLVDMNMKPGVVNVLIDYVLRINSNKLAKNFVEAIASQWKRSNIETVEAAMEISKQEHKQKSITSTKTNFNTKIRSEDKPKWFDEDIKQVEDIDKQRKLEEMLNRI